MEKLTTDRGSDQCQISILFISHLFLRIVPENPKNSIITNMDEIDKNSDDGIFIISQKFKEISNEGLDQSHY